VVDGNLTVDHNGELIDADRDLVRQHKPALLTLLPESSPAPSEAATPSPPPWPPRPAGPPLLSDADVLSAIDRGFDPTWWTRPPAGADYGDRGPRDVRKGDRWLSWHFHPDGTPKDHM
jgi:hypothetical protein